MLEGMSEEARLKRERIVTSLSLSQDLAIIALWPDSKCRVSSDK